MMWKKALIDRLALLLYARCNVDQDTIGELQQRLWKTFREGTYLIRFDTQERIIGWCDYDCSVDGMVHVRKIVAFSPQVLRSMVTELKRSLPWKQVFFYRSKYGRWKHHGRPRRWGHALV